MDAIGKKLNPMFLEEKESWGKSTSTPHAPQLFIKSLILPCYSLCIALCHHRERLLQTPPVFCQSELRSHGPTSPRSQGGDGTP